MVLNNINKKFLYHINPRRKWDLSILNSKSYGNFSGRIQKIPRILRHIGIEKFLS